MIFLFKIYTKLYKWIKYLTFFVRLIWYWYNIYKFLVFNKIKVNFTANFGYKDKIYVKIIKEKLDKQHLTLFKKFNLVLKLRDSNSLEYMGTYNKLSTQLKFRNKKLYFTEANFKLDRVETEPQISTGLQPPYLHTMYLTSMHNA